MCSWVERGFLSRVPPGPPKRPEEIGTPRWRGLAIAKTRQGFFPEPGRKKSWVLEWSREVAERRVRIFSVRWRAAGEGKQSQGMPDFRRGIPGGTRKRFTPGKEAKRRTPGAKAR